MLIEDEADLAARLRAVERLERMACRAEAHGHRIAARLLRGCDWLDDETMRDLGSWPRIELRLDGDGCTVFVRRDDDVIELRFGLA